MFLDKFSRFIRCYDLTFRPRHRGAAYLPLNASAADYSVRDALQSHMDAERALQVQPNGDVVELMAIDYDPELKALALLFHRASPNAQDPAYRRKARAAAGKKLTIRQTTKEEGEEQSVSAHLVVRDAPNGLGVFRSALEEIPGVSMSAIKHIIADAMTEYPYGFERGKERGETYSVVKADGLKSETLTNALRKGNLDFVTLVRPAKPKFVDAGGLFEPTTETMRLRVTGRITSENWREAISNLMKRAKAEGWDDFKIDLNLDDKRSRTIAIDRHNEAKEIMFVRSKWVQFKSELPSCTASISKDFVRKALSVIKEV